MASHSRQEWAEIFAERLYASDDVLGTIEEIKKEINGFTYANNNSPVDAEYKKFLWRAILELLQARKLLLESKTSTPSMVKLASDNKSAITTINKILEILEGK